MFRFTARASPNFNAQTAFKFGASSINFYGKDISRRSFNRANTPVVKGFINTTNLIAAGVPASAFASLWCLEQASSGGIFQLGSEDALNGILGSLMANSAGRMGAAALSDCAASLSRSLLSNAMSMQWTLCCKTMAVMVTTKALTTSHDSLLHLKE